MIDPTKYCIFMNNYSFIDNDGYVAMCCKNLKNKLTQYHISEHRLIDIWNSPEMNAVRDEMARGDEVSGCFADPAVISGGERFYTEHPLGSTPAHRGLPVFIGCRVGQPALPRRPHPPRR